MGGHGSSIHDRLGLPMMAMPTETAVAAAMTTPSDYSTADPVSKGTSSGKYLYHCHALRAVKDTALSNGDHNDDGNDTDDTDDGELSRSVSRERAASDQENRPPLGQQHTGCTGVKDPGLQLLAKRTNLGDVSLSSENSRWI